MTREEIFLPLPVARRELIPMASHMKGTWLVASSRALKSRGRLDEYLGHLPRRYHDVIQHSTISDWHSIDVLLAHYEALDRLELPAAEIVEMARDVTQQTQGNVFVMAARVAASAVDAWTILAQFQTIWSRFVRGAGIGIWKLGPKEARLEVVQFPASRSRYCQLASRGVVANAMELFCSRVYVTEIPKLMTPTQMAFRLAWA
jgi:hypothetical protein